MASAADPGARTSTRTLLRSTLFVGAVRGVDFLLSFLVSVLLASRFGAGGQLDAFFLARRTTVGFADTVRKLVGQVVMPSVVAQLDAGGQLSVRRLPRRVHLFLGGFVVVTLIGVLVPSALVGIFAPGFDAARHDLTATMMTIMMPLLPVAVVASLLAAMLQAKRRFLLSEWTNAVQRALLVLVLAFAIPPLGIVAGAWTMLVAGVVGTAILLVGAWPLLKRHDSVAEHAVLAPAPTTAGGGIAAAIVLNLFFQATALIDFAVASTLPAGGIAALEYGARLVSLVPGLVMSSLYTVLQPELVRAMQHPDRHVGAKGMARFQRIGFFVQLPVSIGMILGAELMIRILFGYGSFGEASIALATGTTAGYAAAAIFLTPLSAATGAIYADPRRSCLRDIAIIAGVGVVVRGGFVAAGAAAYGAPGIAWAAAAATLAAFAVAQWVATRRFDHFEMRDQLIDFAKSTLAGAVALAAGWGVLAAMPDSGTTIGRLAELGTLGMTVVIVYASAAAALRIPEVSAVRDTIAKLIAKRRGRA